MAKLRRSPEGYAKQQAYIREWQRRNRGRIADRQRVQRQELREECLRQYGGTPPRCVCCGATHVEYLVVVATDGDILWGTTGETGTARYRKLRKENYPPGYTVYCWNCTMARSHHGVCPHETEASRPEGHVPQSNGQEARPAKRGSDHLLVVDRRVADHQADRRKTVRSGG